MNYGSFVRIRRPITLMSTLLLLVVACGGRDGKVESAVVESAVGTLSLSSASIVDSIGGQVAQPGYQILVLEFGGEGDIDSDALMEASEGVYVIGNDGSRTERFMAGTSTLTSEEVAGSARCSIGFTPPSSATGFTLHWPGNEPIVLELSE